MRYDVSANPKESNRNRTWFSIEDAKQRLRDGRKNDDGEEFARVVQRAVARIRQLRDSDNTDAITIDRAGRMPQPQDALHRVQFEAFSRDSDRRVKPDDRRSVSANARDERVLPCEVLPVRRVGDTSRSHG